MRFAREGIHHIFIGPDHILFIVGLLLLGGGLRRLAKIVTAFTLAHSVTLAVAPLVVALSRRSPTAGARLVAWGSAAVVAAGSFWFVQRVFFTA